MRSHLTKVYNLLLWHSKMSEHRKMTVRLKELFICLFVHFSKRIRKLLKNTQNIAIQMVCLEYRSLSVCVSVCFCVFGRACKTACDVDVASIYLALVGLYMSKIFLKHSWVFVRIQLKWNGKMRQRRQRIKNERNRSRKEKHTHTHAREKSRT